MTSAVDVTSGIQYAASGSYTPDGSLAGFVSGSVLTNTFIYNSRLQPCRMTASTTGAIPTNCTNSWGNVLDLAYDFHLGNGDNGTVYGITNYRDQTRNQTFTYDQLNRLVSAQNTGTDCSQTTANGKTKFWGNNYGYDAWGNLLFKAASKCTPENLNVTADAQNRLHVTAGADYQYDAAGNMTYNAAGMYYSYDAESRILHMDTSAATYTYNSLGNRVRKDISGAPSTEYFYFSGQPVAELNPATGAFTNYVYFDGNRVARRDGTAGPVSYYFSDHLKTTDIVTDAQGNIKTDSDFYPWGGELQFLASDPNNHYKFTGKERDSETGLDYFGKRYFSSAMGRWTSPDPLMMKVDRLIDPQRLNLYAYVDNNPVTNRDPDGADLVAGSGDQKAIKAALKEIASHPGGREFLTKLDKLTQKITLDTGTGLKRHDGTTTPGRNRPEPGSDPRFERTRDSNGNITDIKSPNVEVTIDPDLSQAMRDTHDPEAPKSDAELLGHELKEVEQSDFQIPHSETGATDAIDAILNTPVNKDLKKTADQFVNDLLKPNAQNSGQQPTPEQPKKDPPD
jgi:RHS repeat-associated protein